MATTLAEQLTSVQAAIAAIEAGAQVVTINGRTFQRANLDILYKREMYLLGKIDRESSGPNGSNGSRTVAEF